MDAYTPVVNSVTPCMQSPALDEPWQIVHSTQTLIWYRADAQPVANAGYSSTGKIRPLTFFLVESPEIAGLERLRSFKGWADNWDGEGSKAPAADVLDASTKIFSLLSVHRVPKVMLTADGQPMFSFSGDVRGEVVMTAVDRFDYFFAGPGEPADEDVHFDGFSLPAQLTEHIEIRSAA